LRPNFFSRLRKGIPPFFSFFAVFLIYLQTTGNDSKSAPPFFFLPCPLFSVSWGLVRPGSFPLFFPFFFRLSYLPSADADTSPLFSFSRLALQADNPSFWPPPHLRGNSAFPMTHGAAPLGLVSRSQKWRDPLSRYRFKLKPSPRATGFSLYSLISDF